jgi:Fe-S-cluster-containing hydrogenase component 2
MAKRLSLLRGWGEGDEKEEGITEDALGGRRSIERYNHESKGLIMKILTTPRMERCIGCHSCSLACARVVHKRFSWDTAGIRIRSSGGLSTGFEARTCLACDPAPCAQACPTGAYTQRKGGGVIVRKNLCIRCGECARACPVDAVFLETTGEPFVCIHCGQCVSFCPHDCLEMTEAATAEP